MSAILARLVFLATVTSTLAIAERPTRETTTDRTIQETQVLNVNPNIKIYTKGPHLRGQERDPDLSDDRFCQASAISIPKPQ